MLIAGASFFVGVLIILADESAGHNIVPTQLSAISIVITILIPFQASAFLVMCREITSTKVFLGFGLVWTSLMLLFLRFIIDLLRN